VNIDLVTHILSIIQSENYLESPEKQARVCDCEKQIDQLVYKLYSLMPEEIETVGGENEDAKEEAHYGISEEILGFEFLQNYIS